MSAALLTGCDTDRTATVIYNDVPPPLTVKTFSESLPPETYSQYMETYTPTSESETTDMYHYLVGINGGMVADTGLTVPTAVSGADMGTGGSTARNSDTAATDPTVTAMPEPISEMLPETTAPLPGEDGGTVTCVTVSGESLPVTETAEISETTAFSLIVPKADTGNYGAVSAVTAPTRLESGSDSVPGESETETSE